MKWLLPVSVRTFAVPFGCIAAVLLLSPPASARVKQVDVRVVAEQTDEGATVRRPTREQPAFYVAHDGGLIEAGDGVAGDTPPTPAAVGQALRSALGSQGYEPASPASAPSLVLIYHWGVIRPSSFIAPTPFKISPNLKARLALVAPVRIAQRVENYLLSRKMSSEINRNFPTPAYLGPDSRDALDLARDSFYFVVVSAYDRAALSRHEKTLLWRTKLTARDVSGSMDEVIATLINAGASYLGVHVEETISFKSPLVTAAADLTASNTTTVLAVSPGAGELDAGFVAKIIKQEHDFFSGEYGASLDEKPRTTKTATVTSSSSDVPPALTQRIANYSAEKAALQSALAAKIKSLPAGVETRETIDTFNTENAARITALNHEREGIRAELARLASAGAGRSDKSLDALRREFAADVEHLESNVPLTPR